MLPLILYDIPSKVEGTFWSPNTFKSRAALSYKGLPFDVEWLEYPDIAPRMKEIGAAPGDQHPDGSDYYTVPVLKDPNTGKVITTSWHIATYLDQTYPEKPIFPGHIDGLVRVFDAKYVEQMMPFAMLPLLRVAEIVNEASFDYFISTREEYTGMKMSEFSPEGPVRDEQWAVLEKALRTTKSWYDESGGKWLVGNTFSYADIVAASRLFWYKKALHVEEWEKIATWDNGRWEELLADVERECKVSKDE